MAAIVSIPVLITELGSDKFGILTIAWMVIGYFSLFDLGLSRALTQSVSEMLGRNEMALIPQVAWSGLVTITLFGCVGAMVLYLISPWLAQSMLAVPETLQMETLQSLRYLALSIPLVTVTAGIVGILSSFHLFSVLSIIRIPLGLFTYASPLLVLPFSNSLEWIVVVLLLGRVLFLGAHMIAMFWFIPVMRQIALPVWRFFSKLVRLGMWMNISNIIGPLMVYLDRFIIGATISMTAVAYYVTPYEVVTKLLIVPHIVSGVLFPALSTTLIQSMERARTIYSQAMRLTIFTIYPLIAVIAIFSYEILELWVNREFAEHGYMVLRWLALGILANCIAQMGLATIQASGRADITAKIHLLELPFYLLLLWQLMQSFGIEGVAMAWMIRASVDAVLLIGFANLTIESNKHMIFRNILHYIYMIIPIAGIFLVTSIVSKILLTIMLLLLFYVVLWIFFVTIEEKLVLRKLIRM